MIETQRTRLLPWSDRHSTPFVALYADAEVMADYGGPRDSAAAFHKIAQFTAAYDRFGFCRWALESMAGDFLGYVGVMPSPPDHPLGPHVDIGWRLARDAWGNGYATEAARAALADFFARHPASEVLGYTAPDNLRSQAVMERLRLRRDPARDFTALYDGFRWHGLVWVADRAGCPPPLWQQKRSVEKLRPAGAPVARSH